MRIVIVEDHPVILNVITLALQAEPGYDVLPLSTAEAGLAACDEATDLAIFDNQLPDMTGIEAVARLRTRPGTRHLPVIVITGDSDRKTRLAAIRAGANDFLEKPVQIDELRMRARNLLALRLAQREANEGRALLETLIGAAGASLAVADARQPGAPILYASDPLLAKLRAGPEEVLNRGLDRLWADAAPQPARERLEQALASGGAGRFVLAGPPAGAARPSADPADDPGALPGSSVRWSEIALTPVAGPGNATRYLVASLNDVTDLVETRQAHAHLSSRLADIARISGAWFFEMNAELRLTYVSTAMALALGATPDRLVGLSLSDLPVRLADPDRRGTPVAALLGPPHRPLHQVMVTLRLPDATIRAVQVSASPFTDDQGRFAGYRGHAGDVSEIARARDQAARASRAKSVFLATMSHEMRTPLTAIVGLSDVAVRDDPPPPLRAQLDQIRAAALNLSSVLSDVLDVASMEQGSAVLNPAPFDPLAEARRTLDPLREAAQAKGLDFSLEPAGAGAQAARMGDAARFATILRALVSNAVKFTAQGRVAIRLDLSDPDGLALTVTDTGIGMSPEELRTAALPFVQADDGIARRYEGAGLGLSIVTWLTAAMAGQFDLDSARGAGTCARVTLPLPRVAAAPPTAEVRPAAASAAAVPLEGCRVLVADDNRTNRHILLAMLRKMGARVTLCADGPEALEAWRRDDFDLVLLDINMPVMAGTDVIRTIRRDEAARGHAPVPAVAITANARPDQVAVYRSAGFDDCVPKPFTSADLNRKLGGYGCRLAG